MPIAEIIAPNRAVALIGLVIYLTVSYTHLAQYEAEESYEQYADLRIGQALLAEMQTRADWEAEHPTPAEPDAPAAPTEAGAYSITEPYVLSLIHI